MRETENKTRKFDFAKLLKRFGIAGFLFFFIKGLLWLIVPAALIWFGISC